MTALLALESTLISHGLPYPQNIETARRLEALAREQGAEPRTVAVINGQLRAGLSADELHHLASTGGPARPPSPPPCGSPPSMASAFLAREESAACIGQEQ